MKGPVPSGIDLEEPQENVPFLPHPDLPGRPQLEDHATIIVLAVSGS